MTSIAPAYSVRRPEQVPPVPCPCGQSTRIVTAADGLGCSFHITAITDSTRHYHRKSAEVYYILEGSGQMELDGEAVTITPGTVITIPPGTRHRLTSERGVRTIVFGVPAFDADDEYFD
ncbi:MAG TPA: cupin domain-containing protein [Gemmataceae bacterium]|nr:cupin domain-containing protein [Gemmataceae bacterium]